MPRFNGSGDVLMGLSGPISINGKKVLHARGSACAWLNDWTVVANIQVGQDLWNVSQYDLRTNGPWERLDERGANSLAAGGGRWYGFQPSRGVFGSESHSVSGLAGVITDNRGSVGIDGALAYVPEYQTGTGLVVGSTPTNAQIVRSVHVRDTNTAVWAEADGTLRSVGLQIQRYIQPAQNIRWCWHNEAIWLAYYTPQYGLIVHPSTLLKGFVIAKDKAYYHDIASIGGKLLLCYSVGQGELPTELRVEDVGTLPSTDFTLPPVIRPLGRKLWTGYLYQFSDRYGDNPSAPGTCTIINEPGVAARVDRFACVSWNVLAGTPKDKFMATWIHASTVEEMEEQVPKARAAMRAVGLPRRPVLGYLDKFEWPRIPSVKPDWYGYEGYQFAGENLEEFKARVTAQLAKFPADAKIFLFAQCSDDNPLLTKDLRSLQPVYLELAGADTRIIGLPWFSDGRTGVVNGVPVGGMRVHEDLRPIHRAIVAAIPDAPAIETFPEEEPHVPSGPSLDTWIHTEYPQVVNAFKIGHPDLGEPGWEWASFQTARRGVGVPEGRWPFAKMLVWERDGVDTHSAADDLPSLDTWIHSELPRLVQAYEQRQGSTPGHEWAAFQSARRGIVVPEGPWTLAKMIAHELGSAGGGGGSTPTNPTDPNTPVLSINGKFFSNRGARWTVIEATDFSLYKHFLTGQNIVPIVDQRIDIGFNTFRVFLLNTSVIPGGLEPKNFSDYYDKLPPFIELVGKKGGCLELVAFTQTKTLMPDEEDQRVHLARLDAAFAGFTNLLPEQCNEWDQHDNACSLNLPRPASGFWSRGSNGADATGVRPPWDWEGYHSNDLSEFQRKVGHNAMEKADETGKPCVANENTRFPDKDNNANHAYDAAMGAALLCAGSCFHSVQGKVSELFTGDNLARASNWVAGAQSVPLEFQAGSYAHLPELEGPDCIRAYHRKLGDGRAHVIKIRP